MKALTSGHGSHICQPPIFQDKEEGAFAGEIREASLSSRIRPLPVRPGQDRIHRGVVVPQAGRQPPRDLVAHESLSWGQADAKSRGREKQQIQRGWKESKEASGTGRSIRGAVGRGPGGWARQDPGGIRI